DAAYLESEKTLADLRYTLAPFYVRDTTNWLDIIEAFALNASNIMPVLTPESTYLGYYELHDVMALFNATPFLSGTGSIIVVQKGVRDYSFSEICQIVEANGSKILGAFVSKIESDMVQVTIKTGHLGMDAIVQTFRRYGYVVVSSHGEDTFLDNLKERSKYLNKYLNI
ncbi:MAG: acetoin utilization protein acuB, partial [Marinirhabdus sp.]